MMFCPGIHGPDQARTSKKFKSWTVQDKEIRTDWFSDLAVHGSLVLPFDNIEDEAQKKLQTVEIPKEVAAQDKEEASKPKPEGRRKRGRVVGGTDVLSEEEFPFYASLRNSASANCGATILGNFHGISHQGLAGWAVRRPPL